jgi:hypothetical protein
MSIFGYLKQVRILLVIAGGYDSRVKENVDYLQVRPSKGIIFLSRLMMAVGIMIFAS